MTTGNLPAYPIEAEKTYYLGLTKRELFAAMAMQGMLAYGENTYDPCVYAASYADRLIAELNKEVQS